MVGGTGSALPAAAKTGRDVLGRGASRAAVAAVGPGSLAGSNIGSRGRAAGLVCSPRPVTGRRPEGGVNRLCVCALVGRLSRWLADWAGGARHASRCGQGV